MPIAECDVETRAYRLLDGTIDLTTAGPQFALFIYGLWKKRLARYNKSLMAHSSGYADIGYQTFQCTPRTTTKIQNNALSGE